MAILVTGGAGYIGSHTCVQLLEVGFEIVLLSAVYRILILIILNNESSLSGKYACRY